MCCPTEVCEHALPEVEIVVSDLDHCLNVPHSECCHVAFQQTAEGTEQERVAIDWSSIMLLDRTASMMAAR